MVLTVKKLFLCFSYKPRSNTNARPTTGSMPNKVGLQETLTKTIPQRTSNLLLNQLLLQN